MRHPFSDVTAFRRDPLGFMAERGNRSDEPLTALRLGLRPVFLVTDPELAKPVLKLDESLVDKGRLSHKLRAVLGLSSLTLSGAPHAARRQAMQPHMARGQVERLAPAMAAEIRLLAAKLAGAGSFEAHKVTAPLALKMIGIALFGQRVLTTADEQVMVEAVRSVEDDLAAGLFRIWPSSPWQARARRRRQGFARAAMGLVVERVRNRAPAESAFRSLERLGLDGTELRDEIMTMLIAGHHTTGTAAAWVLYHLAARPHLAVAVAAEAETLSDGAGEIAVERLREAPVTQALVREVLRLYPSAWWFSREVMQDLHLGGRRLRRGTSLIVCPWQMHRDPRHWEAPDEFRLDRSHAGKTYLPFGAGPRACIGMGLALLQLQVLALEFASAFELAPLGEVAGQPLPAITLIPPPMHLSIRSRGVPLRETKAA